MTAKALQLVTSTSGEERPHRVPGSNGVLSRERLLAENATFAGTGGRSQENSHCGFTPGYMDTCTGIALPSRYADGAPAPIHVLDGLPAQWVLKRDGSGQVLQTRAGIVAGFLLDGRFYTRDQAAALTLH